MKKLSLPVDPKDFQHLYPFQSHFLNRNGLRYHFVDQGEGDPVVMVHGNPTWSFFFRRTISAQLDKRVSELGVKALTPFFN